MHIAHLFATMNRALLFTKPFSDRRTPYTITPIRGIVHGGGVDRSLRGWRNHIDLYSVNQAELFVKADYMSNKILGSYFNVRPCIEDADGWNIAILLLNSHTLALDRAVEQYYRPLTNTGVGQQTCFQYFYKWKFRVVSGRCSFQYVDIAKRTYQALWIISFKQTIATYLKCYCLG